MTVAFNSCCNDGRPPPALLTSRVRAGQIDTAGEKTAGLELCRRGGRDNRRLIGRLGNGRQLLTRHVARRTALGSRPSSLAADRLAQLLPALPVSLEVAMLQLTRVRFDVSAMNRTSTSLVFAGSASICQRGLISQLMTTRLGGSYASTRAQ